MIFINITVMMIIMVIMMIMMVLMIMTMVMMIMMAELILGTHIKGERHMRCIYVFHLLYIL